MNCAIDILVGIAGIVVGCAMILLLSIELLVCIYKLLSPKKMVTEKFFYESADENGVITNKELTLKLRLPTSHAREQLNKSVAEAAKERAVIVKDGVLLDAERDPIVDIVNDTNLSDEVRAEAREKLEAMEDRVNEYSARMDNHSDVALRQQLIVITAPEERVKLTEEVLKNADMERMREIVDTFRRRVARRAA